ncbi:MAG TPA: adenylate kinase [Gemmatimonadaceae bacterium]|nr:adenylate kinase [Gemmatimonadaceae bacterium]
MLIVLLGPPGVGKGTQGELLASALGVPKIATGDVLRAAVKAGTPMGLAAKAAMERGDLVPDDVILGILRDVLASPETARGAVLDGVVRTEPQAEGLRAMLKGLNRSLDVVLLFEAPTDELVKRLSGRTTCENCQTPYTGREPGSTCDKCGGKLVRRADDDPASVRNRIQVYEKQTAPVVAWYRKNGPRVASVDSLGELAAVQARAKAALAQTAP